MTRFEISGREEETKAAVEGLTTALLPCSKKVKVLLLLKCSAFSDDLLDDKLITVELVNSNAS